MRHPFVLLSARCLVVCHSLSCRIHYLQSGATAQFLLNVRDDTHSGVLVYLEGYGHELAVNLVQGLTLGGDEVTYVGGAPA